MGDRTVAGPPMLLAVAHGTREPAGVATIEELLDRVRALRPGIVVRSAYLEVARPSVEAVVSNVTGPVVVVPLLLATGYHATADIPRAVAHSPAADVRIGRVLGPDPLLAEALRDRLREAGWRPLDAVVLGAAGSSDPAAAAATEAQARLLAGLLAQPVVAGYASASSPRVPAAVAEVRAAGADRVAVASYLLAAGHFHSQLGAAGADVLTDPLGSHRSVARLVLVRYDEARRRTVR